MIADLVELCTATPDNAIGTAAVNFCEGIAQGGAVLVEMQHGRISRTEAVLRAEPATRR